MGGTCGKCQFLVQSDWETCKFCGHELSAPPPPPPPPPPGATAAPSQSRRGPGPNKRLVLYGLAAAFAVYSAFAYFVIGDPWTVTNDHGVEVMSGRAISAVCNGDGGAKGTGTYEEGPGRHPMQVAHRDGGSWKSGSPPYHEGKNRFEGEPAAEIELVGCYWRESTPQKEFCRYEKNGRELHTWVEFHNVMVEVRVASTGELIDSDLVRDESPTCPFVVFVDDDGDAEVDFDPHEEIDDYLAPFAGRG